MGTHNHCSMDPDGMDESRIKMTLGLFIRIILSQCGIFLRCTCRYIEIIHIR